jgi:hypothetical protein
MSNNYLKDEPGPTAIRAVVSGEFCSVNDKIFYFFMR